MSSFNKVILLGRITRDIELRATPKGTSVTDIGLAINRRVKDTNGNYTDETTFVDVTFWGRTAEVLNQFSQKGHLIHVEGRLHLDTWTDQQTQQQRSRLKVIGEQLQLLTPKSNDNPHHAAQQQHNAQQQGQAPTFTNDSDIPF